MSLQSSFGRSWRRRRKGVEIEEGFIKEPLLSWVLDGRPREKNHKASKDKAEHSRSRAQHMSPESPAGLEIFTATLPYKCGFLETLPGQ